MKQTYAILMASLLTILLIAACDPSVAPTPTHPPVFLLSTQVNEQVGASLDDAHDDAGGFAGTETTVKAGQGSSSDYTTGFRFTTVNVPAGSIAASAVVSFNVSANTGTPIILKVYAEAADDCVTFADGNRPSAR